jgi:hypothetical protein
MSLLQRCPEWTENDITAYVQMALTILGFASFFCLFFLGLGFVFGYAWYKSLAEYQFDVV